MPRPCTPHSSMVIELSFEVTRGSNIRSRNRSGTPSPSSATIMRRASPERDVPIIMVRAWASRALRSISITASSTQRMSCLACRRSASDTRSRTKPSPRSSSTRSLVPAGVESRNAASVSESDILPPFVQESHGSIARTEYKKEAPCGASFAFEIISHSRRRGFHE